MIDAGQYSEAGENRFASLAEFREWQNREYNRGAKPPAGAVSNVEMHEHLERQWERQQPLTWLLQLETYLEQLCQN